MYIDDLLPHAPLELCSYWGCGQVFHYTETYTVNREYFDVKIFSDSMACVKIKRTKYMHNINDNAVQDHLSENYLTQKIIT